MGSVRGGDDALTAGDENDVLSGGGGDDTLTGGDGDDTYQLVPEEGGVTIDDSAGEDTIDASLWYGVSGVALDLAFADDTWQTVHEWHDVRLQFTDDEAIENAIGSPLDDVIYGSSIVNSISGGGGADQLFGGDDDDELHGDDGNDHVDGEAGQDQLDGGEGDDSYSESDDDNDPHAPQLDDITDVQVLRHYQIDAFRLVADDPETAYSELEFSVSQTSGPENIEEYIDGNALAHGVLAFVSDFALDLLTTGDYEFDVTVTDPWPTGLTDTKPFTLTIDGYNASSPRFYTPYQWLFYATSIDGVGDGSVNYQFTGFDPADPQSSTFTYGGFLDSEGYVAFEWDDPDYLYESYREVLTVTDNGTDDEIDRSYQIPIYIWQNDVDFATSPGNVIYTNPPVAFDNHYKTEINTSFTVNLGAGELLGNPADLNYLPVAYGAGPTWVAPVFTEPEVQHGTIPDFDPTDGSFTYIPNEGWHGLEVATYKITHPAGKYRYNSTLQYNDQISNVDSDYGYLYIEVGPAVTANLTIEGLAEENENPLEGGWSMALNDDDDNNNGRADLDELRDNGRENDLQEVSTSYSVRDDAYKQDFLAYFEADGGVRLWTSPTKEEEIYAEVGGTHRTFLLDDLPKKIWVEGIARGASALTLNVVNSSSYPLFKNIVAITSAMAATTAADVIQLAVGPAGLTAYRPMYGPDKYDPFTKVEVEDKDEANDKLGPGIRMNRDDDNNNGTKDLSDTGVQNENDLIEVSIEREEGQNSLILQRLNTNIKVWNDLLKSSPIEFDIAGKSPTLNFNGNLSKTVYVEWFAESHGTDQLELIDTQPNPDNVVDTLVFHSFEGIVLGFSGKVPEGHTASESGMYGLATEIYKRGFDVYYFPETAVKEGEYRPNLETGTGDAFRAIIEAVRGKPNAPNFDRKVTHVGIFGHSYGGSATHDLAWRTKLMFPALQIDYTAYVDAIRRIRLPLAETSRPPGSKFHDNYYQKMSTIHGEPTDAGVAPEITNNVRIEVDRTEWLQPGPPPQDNWHQFIDDEKRLWSEILVHMHQVMKR